MEKYGKISIVNETRQAERQRIKRTPSPKCLGPEICLEDMMMEKIKFVMTDTGAQVSALCRQALEAKGVASAGRLAGRLHAGSGCHHGEAAL